VKAVNLLPPDMRGTPKRVKGAPAAPARPAAPGGSGPFVVLGALAVCVLAVAAYVLAGNTVKDREAELAEVSARQAATAAKAASLKPYADFQALVDKRIQTVTDLAGMRFDWEQALRDVSRALPADVKLSALNGTLGGDSGGASSNPLRSAIQAPALELKGCTTSQSRVARLMARLRLVRGVTRVSLAKSDKESAGGTNGASTQAGAQATPSCGAGNPPEFEVVVFFERSAALATAAGSSAAGAQQNGAAQSGSGQSNQSSSSSGSTSTTGTTSTTDSAGQGATTP
jgi:Tfp pilus assembly protein PilN